MKTLFNVLRQANTITQESVIVNRKVLKFDNSKGTLWSRAKRYAY
ncbi:hypothetical protein [Pontimicrobium sp. MEBiC01747]